MLDPVAFRVALHHGGLQLAEGVREAGVKYQAAAQAVKWLRAALADDSGRQDLVVRLKRPMSIF